MQTQFKEIKRPLNNTEWCCNGRRSNGKKMKLKESFVSRLILCIRIKGVRWKAYDPERLAQTRFDSYCGSYALNDE